MSSKRRRFSGELKAKVALEALRGDRTLQEIASQHQVHPNQVGAWKRQAMEVRIPVYLTAILTTLDRAAGRASALSLPDVAVVTLPW